ncbi:uncharacterized protein DFL_002803 [Arthrobotrys flagrans]|uniref:Uncharacterized protein n=1 Tax=Arthrobotrys flagrans TaxID=97331 RepID=A0A437ABI0_ARTFL|nr:hypothetical protein DFL_002803 [Arthrobotrys flagrans]
MTTTRMMVSGELACGRYSPVNCDLNFKEVRVSQLIGGIRPAVEWPKYFSYLVNGNERAKEKPHDGDSRNC